MGASIIRFFFCWGGGGDYSNNITEPKGNTISNYSDPYMSLPTAAMQGIIRTSLGRVGSIEADTLQSTVSTSGHCEFFLYQLVPYVRLMGLSRVLCLSVFVL